MSCANRLTTTELSVSCNPDFTQQLVINHEVESFTELMTRIVTKYLVVLGAEVSEVNNNQLRLTFFIETDRVPLTSSVLLRRLDDIFEEANEEANNYWDSPGFSFCLD